jgi:hypothetical protein
MRHQILRRHQIRNASLIALCYAIQNAPQVGDQVSWQVMESGASGSVSYDWVGTEGLSGSSALVSKKYTSTGRKDALVTVSSCGQTISASCYVNVSPASTQSSPSPSASPAPAPTSSTAPKPTGQVSLGNANRGLVAGALYSLGEMLDSLFAR